MYQTKQLMEERGQIVKQMQDLRDKATIEERNLTNEETELWDRLDKQQDELKSRIDTAQRFEKIDGYKVVTPATQYQTRSVTQRDHDFALRGWLLSQRGKYDLMRDEYRNAADKVGLNLNNSDLRIELRSSDGQTVGSDAAGGYTVNGNMIQGVEKSLLAFDGIRNVARVIRTENGAPLPWITVDDTSVDGSAHTELGTVVGVDVVFGETVLSSYGVDSGDFPISLELIRDTSVDLTGLISELLGERLGRKMAAWHVNGDGTNEPQGVVAASAKGVDTAANNAITIGELVDLEHSVNSAYRVGPNVGYIMNDSTVAYFKKLLDDNKRPLWQPSLAAGAPDRINGWPVWVVPQLDSIASTKKPVLFGNFSKFLIRDVGPISIQVLRELWAKQHAIGIIAYAATDSVGINSGAIKHILMKT